MGSLKLKLRNDVPTTRWTYIKPQSARARHTLHIVVYDWMCLVNLCIRCLDIFTQANGGCCVSCEPAWNAIQGITFHGIHSIISFWFCNSLSFKWCMCSMSADREIETTWLSVWPDKCAGDQMRTLCQTSLDIILHEYKHLHPYGIAISTRASNQLSSIYHYKAKRKDLEQKCYPRVRLLLSTIYVNWIVSIILFF